MCEVLVEPDGMVIASAKCQEGLCGQGMECIVVGKLICRHLWGNSEDERTGTALVLLSWFDGIMREHTKTAPLAIPHQQEGGGVWGDGGIQFRQ